MKTNVYRVYLQDDVRTFPCGWRYVLAQIGHKWVRLRDYDAYIHDPKVHRLRIRRETWDKLGAVLCEALDRKVNVPST